MSDRATEAGANEPLLVPFTVVVDTREQLPFSFAGLRADSCKKCRPLIVPLVVGTLRQGDYSISGHQTLIAVERKSLNDLYSTLGQGRRRFEDELGRLNDLQAGGYVVIEAGWDAILLEPPFFSKLQPKTVHRSVIAWQQRYPRVHWWPCANRRLAEITTFRILERYMIDYERREKAIAASTARFSDSLSDPSAASA